MKDIMLLKVYEYDTDYTYERYFLVKKDSKMLEKLEIIKQDAIELQNEERYEKYMSESIIEIVETFIIDNFKIVEYEEYEIDCMK